MKLSIERIDLEATQEELRATNTLSDGLANILRNAFNPMMYRKADVFMEREEEEEETENE